MRKPNSWNKRSVLTHTEYKAAKTSGGKLATKFGKFQDECRKEFAPLWTAWTTKTDASTKDGKALLKEKRVAYNEAMRQDENFRAYVDSESRSFASGISQAWAAVMALPKTKKGTPAAFNPVSFAERLRNRDSMTAKNYADIGVAIYRSLTAVQKDRFNKGCDAPVE